MTALEKLQLSQPLTDIYTAMETDLMMAIARQIAENDNNEINATSEWRLKKLAELGRLNSETVRIIASYTGIQSETLTETIETAAKGITERLEPALQACAEDGYISVADGSTPIPEGVKNVTNSFRKQATSDLNTVNTVMQYRAGSSYTALVNRIYDTAKETELHGVLGKHAFSVASGAESRQAAVRKCIQEFAEKGIPAFVDKSGREWSPEAYISMDIRTTVNNTANAAQDACCDRYGLDLFLVDSHMGARPLCAPYQERLISRSNRSGIAHDGDGNEIPFIPLSSTSYGQAAGLFGINCGHHKLPFADGVNFQSYFPYDEKENAERYKEFQKQREMERKIRKTSREADMLKEAGDEEGAKAARKRLAEQRKAYKEYSAEHGLKPHNDRTSVVKMANGQDTFGDVYKDYGKTVDKAENSGIIKSDKSDKKYGFGKSNNYDILESKISSGKITLEINPEKQARHIKGDSYVNGRSYITISIEEAQKIIDEKHGTGEINIFNNGQIKEIINSEKIIGIDIDPVSKVETPTNSAKIHYSKTGTHIVPVRRKDKKDD